MAFFGGGGGAAPADMVGATTSVAGTAGLVPAPAAGKNTRALFSDASFGEVPLLPQYKTPNNRVVRNYGFTGSAGNATFTIKVRAFALIYMQSDGNIDTLGCMTGSGTPSPAFNFNISLWENSESGTPDLYISGVNVSSGTTGFRYISGSISSVAIKRGFYWVSVTTDATTTANAVRLANAPFGQINIGATQPDGAINTFSYTCSSAYDQTTHETFLTSSNTPIVGIEYA